MQLYQLAAGGSRELPSARFCPLRLFRAAWIRRPIELPRLETFPGAACLVNLSVAPALNSRIQSFYRNPFKRLPSRPAALRMLESVICHFVPGSGFVNRCLFG